MGQETGSLNYSESDYVRFARDVTDETRELRRRVEAGRFADSPATVGYELEACLLNERLDPADANDAFLREFDRPQVVPELARCNIEFNGTPQLLAPEGLQRMHRELDDWLARARKVAAGRNLRLAMIGILPTLSEGSLGLDHISDSNRYRAIDRSIARLRGKPYVDIRIDGRRNDYRGRFDSIMAESAATSFQLHLRLPPGQAHHWFNAALAISGPLLAIAANSPYLFGNDLWAETRIPVFAQSVDTGSVHYVTFGSGYLHGCITELFDINASRYRPLLPEQLGVGDLPHLVLHNGTIWRWNRPILDVADPRDMHFRLEHRALPSGPSVIDMVANAALLYGLLQVFSEQPDLTERLPFEDARANFYQAAQHGMDVEMTWFDGERLPAARLWEERLLPMAQQGLSALGVGGAERYLQVAAARIARGLSGAGWQRAWIQRNGNDLRQMLASYLAYQESGLPVCEWAFERHGP